MAANDSVSLVSIDPSQPSSFVTLPPAAVYVTGSLNGGYPTGIAAGSDGQLYVAANGYILRVDPALGGGIPIATGGARLAADQSGHLFTTFGNSVLRIDIASGATTRIIGTAQTTGVVLGPLPGSLNKPEAIAVTSSGDLLVGNSGELVILRAHLQ
jgi:streptogramin lyase